MAGVVALLALVLTAFTLTSLVLSGRAVDAQLEEGVHQAWDRSATSLARGRYEDRDDDDRSPLEAPGHQPEVLALIMDDDEVLEAARLDEDGYATDLSAEDVETLTGLADEVDSEPLMRTLDLEAGRHLVEADTAGRDGVVIAGLPTAPVEGTKAALARVQVLGSLAALVLAGLLGFWWVRRSLRPLAEVSQAAARVAELPMGSGEVSLSQHRVREDLSQPGDEVGAVGHALNRLIDSVDSAFEQRHRSEQRLRTFVADASHELRTPLAGVRGYTEMIGLTEALTDRGRESLGRVLHQADRMGSLVEDLLLLARLDSGREPQRSDVDLGEVVMDAVMDATAASQGHIWTVDVPEEPLKVHGDRRQLAQLVTNLLSNARKHTPTGTRVAVRLEEDSNGVASGLQDDAGDEPAQIVRLTVEDDGPGISPELLPNLFERFVRGDTARTTTEESTGLGLSIVRSVARAHGGTARVESEPGRTRFTVELPAA